MKKKALIISLCVVAVAAVLITYFIIPLQKTNEIVVYTAKQGAAGMATMKEYDNSFLPDYSDYARLKFADYEIGEDEFSNVKTKVAFKEFGFAKIRAVYDIEIVIDSTDGNTAPRTYNGTIEVTLKFADFRWYIDEIRNGEGLVEYDESWTFERCQGLRLVPLDKNVGTIENAEQAIEKARSLWESETEYMGEKFYSPEEYPDIRINYDEQEDCWIIVGTHFAERDDDETTMYILELLPISIIKSTGEVLHNGVLD